ncbi:hypothetical protein BJN42_15270 [Pseudomonas koreensis]|jgi:hypothetical protein|uniref:Ig-like domain-containing protein n=1 Tax=Pseudomonas sp. GXM4 TaxID=2651867 RepID=UPI0008AADF6A|nr:Ig-like domain-containing protein [Pseudomonas sp. GXM4]KAB2525768.1 hypothetical protein F8N49_10535 [Pseudomonas sp. GXM4]OFJ44579.1 hypothetical protein BJN42_15270 [Pseudomonas koreensis]
MSDQEKLSAPLTPAVATTHSATANAPVIREVTNGKGESIPNGGISNDSKLKISGSGLAGEAVHISDAGRPVAVVSADVQGNFIVALANLQAGQHTYVARSADGVVSPQWTVTVAIDVLNAPVIETVYEPDGKIVPDGQSTFHDELNFIGQGIPGRIVELLNNGTVIRLLNIDSDGHWSANVSGLQPGIQRFVARDPNGHESSSWQVEVIKPTALTIKFVLGQERFQEIGNQGVTTDRSVTITGTGIPGETGWIVDYQNNLVNFVVDEHGVYSATITDLAVNHVHTFRCKSDSGRLSAPWAIRVTSSEI